LAHKEVYLFHDIFRACSVSKIKKASKTKSQNRIRLKSHQSLRFLFFDTAFNPYSIPFFIINLQQFY
ncbi:hypothetical protein SMU82_03531, partial [Streptococcus mutans SM6]